MPSSARGVHLHPELKLGKAPPVDKPKLKLSRLLTGIVPAHPPTVDDIGSREYGLDDNDRFGVCVPTGYDNLRRLTTGLLTGQTVTASQDQIFEWYRTQNPAFDPMNYSEADDQGMVVQDFLSHLAKTGEILAFAAVDHTDPEEMKAALYLFLGLILGVDLQVAQQSQLEQPAVWDYRRSGEWGGHCVTAGAYDPYSVDVVTWANRVKMTQTFQQNQLDEAWVVIRPEHLTYPAFREGVDLEALAIGYMALTGRELPQLPVRLDPVPDLSQLTLTITDPEVVFRVARVARSSSPDEWITHHLRSYFDLK